MRSANQIHGCDRFYPVLYQRKTATRGYFLLSRGEITPDANIFTIPDATAYLPADYLPGSSIESPHANPKTGTLATVEGGHAGSKYGRMSQGNGHSVFLPSVAPGVAANDGSYCLQASVGGQPGDPARQVAQSTRLLRTVSGVRRCRRSGHILFYQAGARQTNWTARLSVKWKQP